MEEEDKEEGAVFDDWVQLNAVFVPILLNQSLQFSKMQILTRIAGLKLLDKIRNDEIRNR